MKTIKLNKEYFIQFDKNWDNDTIYETPLKLYRAVAKTKIKTISDKQVDKMTIKQLISYFGKDYVGEFSTITFKTIKQTKNFILK